MVSLGDLGILSSSIYDRRYYLSITGYPAHSYSHRSGVTFVDLRGVPERLSSPRLMGMLLVGEMTTVIVILSKSFSSLDGS